MPKGIGYSDKEPASQARQPQRPAEHMASKAKGSKSATPGLPSEMGSHVPTRAAEHTAAKGTHVDSMGKMAQMQEEHRRPMIAPSHKNSDGRPGKRMGG